MKIVKKYSRTKRKHATNVRFSKKYIYYKMLLLLFFMIFFLFLCQAEHFSLSKRVQTTIYNYDRKKISYLPRDDNTKRFVHSLMNHFPLTLNNTRKKEDYVFIPQCLNTEYMDYQFVANLYKVHFTLLLPLHRPKNVKSIEDISLLKIGIIQDDEASFSVLSRLLQRFDLQYENISIHPSEDTIEKAWESGKIDAIFMLCSHPNQYIYHLSIKHPLYLFDWSTILNNATKPRLLLEFPDLMKSTYPIFNYRIFQISKTMNSLCFNMNLLSRPSNDPENVYGLLETLTKYLSSFVYQLDFLHGLQYAFLSISPVYLYYHKGAFQYYSDQNLLSNDSDLCFQLRVGCTSDTKRNATTLLRR